MGGGCSLARGFGGRSRGRGWLGSGGRGWCWSRLGYCKGELVGDFCEGFSSIGGNAGFYGVLAWEVGNLPFVRSALEGGCDLVMDYAVSILDFPSHCKAAFHRLDCILVEAADYAPNLGVVLFF